MQSLGSTLSKYKTDGRGSYCTDSSQLLYSGCSPSRRVPRSTRSSQEGSLSSVCTASAHGISRCSSSSTSLCGTGQRGTAGQELGWGERNMSTGPQSMRAAERAHQCQPPRPIQHSSAPDRLLVQHARLPLHNGAHVCRWPQQLLQAHNDGIQSIEAQVGVPLCAWVALCACRVTLRFFFLVAVAC